MDPAWSNLVVLIITLLIHSIFARLDAINNALSRSTVEKLAENGVSRAALLLSMFNPRNVFGQAIWIGQITTISVGCCILFLLVTADLRDAIESPWPAAEGLIAIALFVFVALLITNLSPPFRREEGSEAPLPRIILVGYPLYLLFLLPGIILQVRGRDARDNGRRPHGPVGSHRDRRRLAGLWRDDLILAAELLGKVGAGHRPAARLPGVGQGVHALAG